MPFTTCASSSNDHTGSRTFDSFLGPAHRRYFGTGYRRTSYVLEGLELVGDVLNAYANVSYSADWSQKAGVARVPHLSTIDAAILAAGMSETYLASTLPLSVNVLRNAWIERFTIRAGTTPLDTTRAVPLSSSLSARSMGKKNDVRTVLTHRIGPMRVVTAVRHSAAGPLRKTPSPCPTQPHIDSHRENRHDGRVLWLEAERGRLLCSLDLHAESGPTTGLEAAYRPSATFVDALVLAGQMAQILLYARQNVDRDMTPNLWMRHVSINRRIPRDSAAFTTTESCMRVVSDRVVAVDRQEFHSVNVTVPDLFGFAIESAVAL
ncbi:hypothetical protein J2Y69_000368 [Microbacterium resistens]|uniref:Avirulence D protein (AvrD) n=1 Tax=Microbacterium resistens TaxID=156977 RepID=A0ABU1S857_9MICO|nr:hypothetical protein [Microbacterium resistens]